MENKMCHFFIQELVLRSVNDVTGLSLKNMKLITDISYHISYRFALEKLIENMSINYVYTNFIQHTTQ